MAVKAKMIEHIKDVIKAHERHQWLLGFTINGVLTKENAKELWIGEQQCECGLWLTMRKDWIIEFFDKETYNKLYLLHRNWHKELYKIKELYEKSNKGLLKKFVGTKRLEDGDLDIGKAYFDDAKRLSDEFLKTMNNILIKASNIPQYRYDKFEDER